MFRFYLHTGYYILANTSQNRGLGLLAAKGARPFGGPARILARTECLRHKMHITEMRPTCNRPVVRRSVMGDRNKKVYIAVEDARPGRLRTRTWFS